MGLVRNFGSWSVNAPQLEGPKQGTYYASSEHRCMESVCESVLCAKLKRVALSVLLNDLFKASRERLWYHYGNTDA